MTCNVRLWGDLLWVKEDSQSVCFVKRGIDKLNNWIDLLTVFFGAKWVFNWTCFANLACSYVLICPICWLISLHFVELREKHHWELENLTLTSQPFKTLKFFTLAVIQYIKKTAIYLLAKGGWVMLFSVAVGTLGIVLMTLGCLHEKVFVFSQ